MPDNDAYKYVGVSDNDLEIFESQYPLPDGMLYNSYVLFDEKTVIFDTVDKRAVDEWISNVKNALGDRKPDFLVIHHLEPDHSAGILKLHELYPDMKLIGNAKTFQMLPQFFDEDLSSLYVTVKDKESLSFGKHEFFFYLAPMVHWPEVMVSFDSTDGILFSADAFGKFGVSRTTDKWDDEARRYYFNIVGKYGNQVQMLLKKLTGAGIDIKTIFPLHGPVLDGDLSHYLGLYDKWSRYEPEDKKVLIAVASIHGNTLEAARYLKECLEKAGEQVVLDDVTKLDVSYVVSDCFRYDRIVFMASSYDGGVFSPMETLLYHLVSKMLKNRKFAIVQNGSWGPVAERAMLKIMEPLKGMEKVGDTVTIKTTMSSENKKELQRLAEELKEA